MLSQPKQADAEKMIAASKESPLWSVYLWVLSYIRPYKGLFVSLLLCGALVTGIELVIPMFIRYFIDHILPDRKIQLFYTLIIAIAVLIIIMIALSALRVILQRNLQEKAASDLQYGMMKHLRALGFSYFDRHAVGESLSLVNTEVSAVANMYRKLLPMMVNELVFAILALGCMMVINVKMALIILPCLLLYYVVGPYFEKRATKSEKEWAESRVDYNRKVYESVASLAELRASAAEDWDNAKLTEARHKMDRGMITTFWYSFWRGSVRRLLNYAGLIAVFIYGFHLYKQGSLTVGEFSAFLLYYFNALFKLTLVITTITEQRMLMYQARRLYDFVHLKPEIKEPLKPALLGEVKGAIDFNDVSFAYVQGQSILEHFSLSVQAGQRVAFVGASGGGKSTLLKLIGRFYDPSMGSVLLDGTDLRDLSLAQLRNSLGFVFQETYLFGASVMENIRFGNPDASDEEVVLAAQAAGADAFISQMPQGYDTMVGERGIKLSGGQKQRISIARMFVKNPSIVILDEATSALDNRIEDEVQRALERLLMGRTTIAIAHRLSTIENFDKIVVIENGRVVESGTYQELLLQQGALHGLVHGQTAERVEQEAL
ncbi:Putative multidrug export ATP-binding/permease protein [Paenibacillus plantiphilus]|uniref:Multidrug export ATP-binding/permease protein n=1 Tax=Paenibacillus plantiphilus TaxID=2905650 RepID=A0ABN8GHV6_9BACL|nr:ABC transporter ATP-binding protein [Paenibacillus plantiphilus]CAH1207766.1 Putative multidrug export ATP-binding/permease protein [Paenibacillus plantiphilus]